MSDSLNEVLLDNCNLLEPEPCLTILDLPNEVLDYIFSFLTIQERIRTEWVCRSWAEFGKNYKWSWPKKLKSYMHKHSGSGSDDAWSSILSRCGTSLKELTLVVNNPSCGHTFRSCHVIGVYCPTLTSIKLFIWYPVTDPDAIISITRGCTKLKKIFITLHSEGGRRTVINDDTANVCLALKEYRALQYLDLSCNSPVIEEGCLDAVRETLKGLQIELSTVTKFSIIASKLLQRRDPIEKLVFHWLEFNVQDWPMKVVHHYENTLRELDLPFCQMTSSYWCKIPVKLKHLEVLMLSSSSLIEDDFLHVLADSCKKLRELNIKGTAVTDVGVSYLTKLPELTVLDVSKTKTTGQGLLTLACCGRLEKVSYNNMDYHAPLIEESCVALAKNSHNLHLLDVSHNVNITNRLVDEFRFSIQHGSLKGPVSLYLCCTKVNNCIEGWRNLHLHM